MVRTRFPGEWFQAESGLHQNWMRDYDPTTERYPQADPLGLVDGASVYEYALQNPAAKIDPDGEQCVYYSLSDGNTGIRCTGGSTFNPSGNRHIAIPQRIFIRSQSMPPVNRSLKLCLTWRTGGQGRTLRARQSVLQ